MMAFDDDAPHHPESIREQSERKINSPKVGMNRKMDFLISPLLEENKTGDNH